MGGIHGDKYEAILDAAYTIFGTKGFYESKISEIAEQAGVAKGTVYLYFKSKEQLFTAVTRRMDILLDKDFRECDVDQTAEFAANLFMHGCEAGSGIRRL
ncbi:UNVERIFIED_CONTAM: AcrR family transcriptional regulator [Paenibacillus sp. PvR008]